MKSPVYILVYLLPVSFPMEGFQTSVFNKGKSWNDGIQQVHLSTICGLKWFLMN